MATQKTGGKFRTSMQYDRLLKNIASGGTDNQRARRKLVLDEVTAAGFINHARAVEVLGYNAPNSAARLLSELVAEGLLARAGRGVYIRGEA